MAKKQVRHDGLCPVERVIAVFGGKWKPAVIYALETNGTLRFNELRRLIPGVSQRMLTQQLRELERDGIISREHFPEIPPRVEYSLTKLGETLQPVGQAIDDWGNKHMGNVQKARKRYDRKTDNAPS